MSSDTLIARAIRDIHSDLEASTERQPALIAEYHFLLNRLCDADDIRGERHRGISSDALAVYGCSRGPRPETPGWTTSPGYWRGDECGHGYPADKSDLQACEWTYTIAPPHVQTRMLPVLEEFRRYVIEDLNRYGHPWREPAPIVTPES